jgi:hypothetical protein
MRECIPKSELEKDSMNILLSVWSVKRTGKVTRKVNCIKILIFWKHSGE